MKVAGFVVLCVLGLFGLVAAVSLPQAGTTGVQTCRRPWCTIVRTATGLEKQVDAWHPKSRHARKVIEIPNGADIDLDPIVRSLPLTLEGGLTIESTRGALRPGALIHLDEYPSTSVMVFRLSGDGARIRNLRLRGPSSGVDGTACGRLYFDECPGLTAIRVDAQYTASISDNEIFDWPSTAIDVRGEEDATECTRGPLRRDFRVRVERNYIHHNQLTGLGYGVKVNDGGFVLVGGNTFDWNRHAVSGDGSATTGYVARYNYVLSGGSRYGGRLTYKGSYPQHFDMHGTGKNSYGGIAGEVVAIVSNTVHGEQKYGTVVGFGGHTRPVYWLRGRPCHQNELRDNVLVHDDAGEAVRADKKDGAAGWVTLTNNKFDSDTSWSNAVGDFDPDGRDDLFQATGAAWYYSSGGVTEWRLLQAGRTETTDRLRLGDFDGDGDTDVFTATGSEWRISRNGSEPWAHLNWSHVPLEDLRFGDFDSDGKTDAFRATGSHWYFSPGAARTWKPLADSAYRLDELRFGNFVGDRRTDVFGIEGGQWSVSDGGTSTWHRLNSLLTRDLGSLVFADFNGNGRTDIAQSLDGGTVWRVAWDGAGDWHGLRTSVRIPGDRHASLAQHWIGRFDATPGADALRYQPGLAEGVHLVRSSGARADYVRHSRNPMR